MNSPGADFAAAQLPPSPSKGQHRDQSTPARDGSHIGRALLDEFNRVMAEYVSDPYPVRTTIPVALRGFDVEIDAILFIPEAD